MSRHIFGLKQTKATIKDSSARPTEFFQTITYISCEYFIRFPPVSCHDMMSNKTLPYELNPYDNVWRHCIDGTELQSCTLLLQIFSVLNAE